LTRSKEQSPSVLSSVLEMNWSMTGCARTLIVCKMRTSDNPPRRAMDRLALSREERREIDIDTWFAPDERSLFMVKGQ